MKQEKNYKIRKITNKYVYIIYIFLFDNSYRFKMKMMQKNNKTKQKTYIVRKQISRIPKINRYWNQMKIATVQTTATTKYLNEIVIRRIASNIHAFTLDTHRIRPKWFSLKEGGENSKCNMIRKLHFVLFVSATATHTHTETRQASSRWPVFESIYKE